MSNREKYLSVEQSLLLTGRSIVSKASLEGSTKLFTPIYDIASICRAAVAGDPRDRKTIENLITLLERFKANYDFPDDTRQSIDTELRNTQLLLILKAVLFDDVNVLFSLSEKNVYLNYKGTTYNISDLLSHFCSENFAEKLVEDDKYAAILEAYRETILENPDSLWHPGFPKDTKVSDRNPLESDPSEYADDKEKQDRLIALLADRYKDKTLPIAREYILAMNAYTGGDGLVVDLFRGINQLLHGNIPKILEELARGGKVSVFLTNSTGRDKVPNGIQSEIDRRKIAIGKHAIFMTKLLSYGDRKLHFVARELLLHTLMSASGFAMHLREPVLTQRREAKIYLATQLARKSGVGFCSITSTALEAQSSFGEKVVVFAPSSSDISMISQYPDEQECVCFPSEYKFSNFKTPDGNYYVFMCLKSSSIIESIHSHILKLSLYLRTESDRGRSIDLPVRGDFSPINTAMFVAQAAIKFKRVGINSSDTSPKPMSRRPSVVAGANLYP